MVDVLMDLPGHVVGLAAHGRVTKDDYEQVVEPAVDGALAGRDRVNVLYELADDFTGMSANAMWHDAKLGFKHRKAWERIAVVADRPLYVRIVQAIASVVPGEVRVFPSERIQRARAWVSAPL